MKNSKAKLVKGILIVLSIIYFIISATLLICFYSVENRIIINQSYESVALQTKDSTYYNVDDINLEYFSPNTIYRINNIYFSENGENITAYNFDSIHKLKKIFSVYDLKNGKINSTQNIYYTVDKFNSNKHILLFAEKFFELPSISSENIEKICVFNNLSLVEEISDHDEIEQIIRDYHSFFAALDNKYERYYTCYFYYKNSYMYEEVTSEYLDIIP